MDTLKDAGRHRLLTSTAAAARKCQGKEFTGEGTLGKTISPPREEGLLSSGASCTLAEGALTRTASSGDPKQRGTEAVRAWAEGIWKIFCCYCTTHKYTNTSAACTHLSVRNLAPVFAAAVPSLRRALPISLLTSRDPEDRPQMQVGPSWRKLLSVTRAIYTHMNCFLDI